MRHNCSRLRASLIVALCSVFVTAWGFSFSTEVSQVFFAVSRGHLSASASASFTDRVLARLAQAEAKESDPWRRDDIRIAWITVLNAARDERDPHFWATYRVLGTSPDQVWPRIEARRKAALGQHYAEFFGVSIPPKVSLVCPSLDAVSGSRRRLSAKRLAPHEGEIRRKAA